MCRLFLPVALTLGAIFLGGCVEHDSTHTTDAADINQARLCQVDTWKPLAVADECQAGQKVLYRPGGPDGTDQAALFAAANCDLRYSVVVAPGGTTCIYRPISSANRLSGDSS